MVASSSWASASSAAVTVTVWDWFQSATVYVSVDGRAVKSVPSVPPMVTTTAADGSPLNSTSYWPPSVSPSATDSVFADSRTVPSAVPSTEGVRKVADADHAPSPSWLTARTWIS